MPVITIAGDKYWVIYHRYSDGRIALCRCGHMCVVGIFMCCECGVVDVRCIVCQTPKQAV